MPLSRSSLLLKIKKRLASKNFFIKVVLCSSNNIQFGIAVANRISHINR